MWPFLKNMFSFWYFCICLIIFLTKSITKLLYSGRNAEPQVKRLWRVGSCILAKLFDLFPEGWQWKRKSGHSYGSIRRTCAPPDRVVHPSATVEITSQIKRIAGIARRRNRSMHMPILPCSQHLQPSTWMSTNLCAVVHICITGVCGQVESNRMMRLSAWYINLRTWASDYDNVSSTRTKLTIYEAFPPRYNSRTAGLNIV